MTTIGLPVPVTLVSDIDATRNTAAGGSSLLGCGACHQNQSQRGKRIKKQRNSANGGSSTSLLSVNKNFANSLQPEISNYNMKSLKPANMNQESLKHAHSEVQDQFAKLLAVALDNVHGTELQCCITYSKPCGCIRKYILGGELWKDKADLQLRNADDIDIALVGATDKAMVGAAQIDRARELVSVYEHAAELKKEKCYAFNNVEVEGKSLKELRGMIGLGNGRKRSKKYEDYVLQMRSQLRTQYSLCEKAAQKLLGYSINFLYKKLRTNPQKTSRLVATNKAERASKAPRHLIPLEELRDMGRKSNSTNQCCGRNCISRLASQQFDKIENWRKRLEGSGQRVAQEIVAEVLRASSSSLDGQSSFCQNLVHWVTGCSFKKIRRVRDHLKKDPQSLPEHGLKKYWKDKVKNKQKPDPVQKIPKTEKQDFPDSDVRLEGMYYYGNSIPQNFGIPYNTMNEAMYSSTVNGTPPRLTHYATECRESVTAAQWPGTNVNNSNNMMSARGFDVSANESKPVISIMPGYAHQMHIDKNRGTPDVNQVASNSCQYQNTNQSRAPQTHAQSAPYGSQDQNQFGMRVGRLGVDSRAMTASPYLAASDASVNQQYNHPLHYLNANHTVKNHVGDVSGIQQQPQQHAGQTAARSSVILHTAGSQHQQAPLHKEPPPYNHVTTSGTDERNNTYNGGQIATTHQNDMVSMAFNSAPMYGQQYYIAAANNGQDNFFHSGMPQGLTPFVLSSGDTENADENKNGDAYSYPRQPLYILSPIPGHGEKPFSASDLQNFKQLPLTPIQIFPTPYLPSGKNQELGNGDGNAQQDPQQFLFPMPITNTEGFHTIDYEKMEVGQDAKGGNQNGAMHFPPGTALTPLAVVHNAGGLFNLGSWPMSGQLDSIDGMQQQQIHTRADGNGQQWPILALQQYPPNVTLDHVSAQPHIMYDPAQFSSYPQQYTTAEMLQPANSNKDTWQRVGEGKKASIEGVSEPLMMTTPDVSGRFAQNSAFQQSIINKAGNVHEQQKDIDDDLEEKESEGIVTPKIIREALSNNFGARAAAAAAISDNQQEQSVPELAPIAKKQDDIGTKTTPSLEMPKLAPIGTRANLQGEEDAPSSEGDNEERCASISARVKRFSRDRLGATIDSPNIILTPFTPLTPSITPAIIIPDTSEDETGKEDVNNSASSTNSQQKDGSIFLFPPTHVSRRAAAIRLQGLTVSDTKRCKMRSPKDSPKTPGPFPVAAGRNSLSEDTDKSESTSNANTENSAGKSPASHSTKTNSPTLTLRGLSNTNEADKIPKDKIPVLGFDTAQWQDGTTLPSPSVETTDDAPLNTPTQQPLNTPTSQLNTPTQQLNTPNQDLKTPTESPVKSLHPAPTKRKREASPSDDSVILIDESFQTVPHVPKSFAPAVASAKSLRFHCFTPKDFNEGVNCSAFRKPSEFASATTESAIAQRRRRPRKQAHPSSVTTPEDEKSNDFVMREVHSPGNTPDEKYDNDDDDAEEDTPMEVDDVKKNKPSDSKDPSKEMLASTHPAKPSLPGYARMPDGNVMILGNPYDSQTPSFFQLMSMFPSSSGVQEAPGRQQTPFSSNQVNTPVFLHSATFLTPGGSGVRRRISPGGAPAGTTTAQLSNTPQIFTFMQGGHMTPNKVIPNQQEASKKNTEGIVEEKPADDSETTDRREDTEGSEKKQGGNSKKKPQKLKHAPMTLPISDNEVPPSPALQSRDGGLQTPSNLKVVTPSLALNSAGSVPASEAQQVFNFPTSGLPGLYPMPTSGPRSAPRGSYVLCTPSKASPTGSKILYHPCTSPSMATGPMALVPIEMLSSPTKKIIRAQRESSNSETQGTSKQPNSGPEQVTNSSKDSSVPLIVVDPPGNDGKGDKTKHDNKEKKESKSKDGDTVVTSSSTSTPVTSPIKSPPPTALSRISKARAKSLGSPKGFPKPLIMNHMNIEHPNVQTPTMIHLVSPSQPNSPLVLYPMVRPPHGAGQAGSKLHSPSSASSTGGTPPLMVLQRFCGPGGSSSLLKSALMKNMPVFQFPPPSGPSISSPGLISANDDALKLPSTSTSSLGPAAVSGDDTETLTTAPSAAVSVICGPRVSTPRISENLSGSNDPCLSEAAQK